MKNYGEEPIKVPVFSEENGFYTSPEKSKQMSRIRAKETKPEIAFRKALWAKGYRYRKNVKKLPGSPDVLLRKYKTVVFIDGEFWHGQDWETKKDKIKTNRDFWIPKIERNMQRDRENNAALEAMGFKVFRFWEKEVKKELESCIQKVAAHLENHQVEA